MKEFNYEKFISDRNEVLVSSNLTKEEIESNKKKISYGGEELSAKRGKELFDYISSLRKKQNVSDDIMNKIYGLVLFGADINYKDSVKGDFVLLLSIRKELPIIADYLISMGANINLSNNYGTTALMAAARHDYFSIVKRLIAMGADVNAQCIDGDTALISSLIHSNTSIVNYLIEHGAQINHKNLEGKSAIDYNGGKNGFVTIPNLLSDKYDSLDKQITSEELINEAEEKYKKLSLTLKDINV